MSCPCSSILDMLFMYVGIETKDDLFERIKPNKSNKEWFTHFFIDISFQLILESFEYTNIM